MEHDSTRLAVACRQVVIRVLLWLVVLLVFWSFGGCFILFGQTKSEPRAVVSCIAVNHPVDVLHADTGKSEEIDDWRVDCSIKRGDKLVYGPKPLILPYPEPFEDAMQAIKEFRLKTAAEILKQLKEK